MAGGVRRLGTRPVALAARPVAGRPHLRETFARLRQLLLEVGDDVGRHQVRVAGPRRRRLVRELGPEPGEGGSRLLGGHRRVAPAVEPSQGRVELLVADPRRGDPLDGEVDLPEGEQVVQQAGEDLRRQGPDVAVDVVTGLLPGDVPAYVVDRVRPLRRGLLPGPRLLGGVVDGPHEVVEHRAHRRRAVAVEVRLDHLAHGRRGAVHVEAVAAVRDRQQQGAVPGEHLGDVAQPADHVGHVLDDVAGHHVLVGRVGRDGLGERRHGAVGPGEPEVLLGDRVGVDGRVALVVGDQPGPVDDVDVADVGHLGADDGVGQWTDLEATPLSEVGVPHDPGTACGSHACRP